MGLLKKALLTIVITLLFIAPLKGQQLEERMLNQSEPSGEFSAREKVTGEPGFEAHPVNPNQVHLFIDPSIQISHGYSNSNVGSNGILPVTKDLDYSLPVGTTSSSYNVTPGGGLSYQVPVSLPPGTMNMIPQLSINYNSQGGNGLLGNGWNLSGLASISRCGQSIYHNGKVEPIQFTNDDWFVFNGNRLIPVTGANGQSNTTYATENESFSRITSYGTVGNGPEHFTIETKEGLTMELGKTADSRFLPIGQSTVFIWMINKLYDNLGNYILFDYNNSNGEIYIKEISYTGNLNAGLDPYNKIQFYYDLRQDANRLYVKGGEINSSVILREIKIKCEDNDFKIYKFQYSFYNVYTVLTEIKEFGSENIAYNSLAFSYLNDAGDPTISSSTVNYLTDAQNSPHSSDSYLDVKYFPLDYNGDGLKDLVAFYAEELTLPDYTVVDWRRWSLLKNNGNSNFTEISSYNGDPGVGFPANFKPADLYPINKSSMGNMLFKACDFNGDGMEDLVTTILDVYYNTVSFNVHLSDGLGYNSSAPSNSFQTQVNFTVLNPQQQNPIPSNSNNVSLFEIIEGHVSSTDNKFALRYLDFDGDTKLDIFCYYDTSVVSPFVSMTKIWLSAANSAIPEIITANTNFNMENAFAVDINGDGKTELANIHVESSKATSLYPEGYYFLRFENGQFVFEQDVSGSAPYKLYFNNNYFGDYNGDGISDYIECKYLPSLDWTLKTGNGNGSYLSTSLTALNLGNPFEQGNPPTTHIDNYYFTQDVNGDGKTDIIELIKHPDPVNNTTGTTSLNIYYSTGISFIKNGPFQINFLVDFKYYDFNFGDFNGDGSQDILIYNTTGNEYTGDSGPTIIYLNKGLNIKYLSESVNGFNVKTEFEYRTLNSGNGLYSLNQLKTFPLNNLNGAFTVVSRIKSPDGIGGFTETQYSYEDAIIHRQGKGFLGFLKVTTKNVNGDIKQIDEYGLRDYATLLPETTHVYSLSSNVLLSEKFIDYLFTPTISSIGYSVFPIRTEANDFSGKNVVSTFSYDNYGNILVQEQNINYGLQISKTEYSNYIQSGSWIPAKPTNVLVSSNRNGQGWANRSSQFEYFSNGLLKKEIKDPGMPLSVVTDYTYYVAGACSTKKVSASGLQDKLTTFNCDPKFRFATGIINPIGQTSIAHYDAKWGKSVYEKGVDGLITRNYFDSFGRLIKTVTPDNLTATTQLKLIEPASIIPGDDIFGISQYIVYSATDSKPSNPTVIKYFDLMGREIIVESEGFQNKIYSQKKYDARGNVDEETGPYENSSTQFLKTKNFFRDINFPNELYKTEITDNSHTNTISYSNQYGGGNTITTIADPTGKQSSKTTDAAGKLIVATDNGGIINYEYNSQGLTTQITVNSVPAASMTYDDYGNQITLLDKNAGTISYEYNAYGELTYQEDANNNVTDNLIYDLLGRIKQKKVAKGTDISNYSYFYVPSGQIGVNQLEYEEVTGPDGTYRISYIYDELNRVKTYNENCDGENISINYQYDIFSNLIQTDYSGGFSVSNEYNSKGYLTKITNSKTGDLIWRVDETNSTGQVTEYTLGNNIQTQTIYDAFGFPEQIYAAGIQDYRMQFDKSSGNLNWRKDYSGNRNLKEEFTYDNLNRLTGMQVTSPVLLTPYNFNFNSNGTIAQKSDAGNYQDYWTNHTDAVRNIYNPVNTISQDQQNINYTPFNKIKSISEADFSLSIKYGPDQQRRKAELRNQGSLVSTKFYFPGYEKEISGSNSREVYYINAPTGLCALYVVENGTATMYYVYKDHLGSILKVADGNGNTSEQSFDAWGRYRNPDDWTYSNIPSRPQWLYRGYTGHEHLPQFSLINMNGRVYDPVLGMMLSPDNFVQEPDNTQNFNRYAYCLNNPLSYVDKDGNFFWFAVAAVALTLGGLNVAQNWNAISNNPMGIISAFTVGAAIGGGSVILGATLLGVAAGIPLASIISGGAAVAEISFGMAFGAAAIATGTATMTLSIANNALFDAPMISMTSWVGGMLIAGVTAGVLNGISNVQSGKDFWTGKGPSNWLNLHMDNLTASTDPVFNLHKGPGGITYNAGRPLYDYDYAKGSFFNIETGTWGTDRQFLFYKGGVDHSASKLGPIGYFTEDGINVLHISRGDYFGTSIDPHPFYVSRDQITAWLNGPDIYFRSHYRVFEITGFNYYSIQSSRVFPWGESLDIWYNPNSGRYGELFWQWSNVK